MKSTRRWFPFHAARRAVFPAPAALRRAAAWGSALAATVTLAAAPTAASAGADGVEPAAARFQALLACAPGARAPGPAERAAWRAAGVSFTGYAHDGGVLLDDRHDAPSDAWEEMRVRFPRPVTIEGSPVTLIHLARQQSGDAATDTDLTVYAETAGEIGAFAAARRLAPLPAAVPAGLDIEGNAEDGHAALFHAGYLRWAMPLSKQQADALSEPGSLYLPGAHRLPSARFAGALVGEPGRFAFGCVVFGPDVTPVDGM
ncbi:hypothetical protein [Burkholderia plantarii]|uniref:Putative exported protein n=1 Tax=Burkholderia plantarii TaxID=41899 RepID=A0A0B6S0E1_BURPL|nr:hypothetical protein [Burkholderia plantarii]AJK49118.1 putative exported protein [Burkholderia plantarii]WLE62427.1 hypothetical protein GIY62_34155 [Burkholderia plantarii]GLZ16528.1 hypothetical protein Bpla01_00580 [Burkholderia plantarii]